MQRDKGYLIFAYGIVDVYKELIEPYINSNNKFSINEKVFHLWKEMNCDYYRHLKVYKMPKKVELSFSDMFEWSIENWKIFDEETKREPKFLGRISDKRS
jgi:hypothetical protein